MKIRWREHEIIFIALLVAIQVIVYLKELYDVSQGIMGVCNEAVLRQGGGEHYGKRL